MKIICGATTEKKDVLIWSLFLFVVIFAPPFIPYPHLLLAAFSCLLLMTKYKKNAKRILIQCGANRWMLRMIGVALYALTLPMAISLILNDIVDDTHYISLFNRYAVLVVTILPCSVLLLCKISKCGYNYHFFFRVIINAGIVEAFCAIMALLSPTIKSYFVAEMGVQNEWFNTVRSYGFARTLVDVFGLGIAIIASISFYYGVFNRKRYVLISAYIAIAALLNARSGVIIYIVSIFMGLFFLAIQGKGKQIVIWTIGILVMVIILLNIFRSLEETAPATYSWIMSGMNSIYEFLNDSSQKSITVLSSEEWYFPGVIRTIIGTGHSVYQAQGYRHTDIGYINDIWFVGVLGCILLYEPIFSMSYYIIKRSKIEVFRMNAVMIVMSFIVFNVKASAIGYNPGMAALLLCLFGMTYFTKIT